MVKYYTLSGNEPIAESQAYRRCCQRWKAADFHRFLSDVRARLKLTSLAA